MYSFHNICGIFLLRPFCAKVKKAIKQLNKLFQFTILTDENII